MYGEANSLDKVSEIALTVLSKQVVRLTIVMTISRVITLTLPHMLTSRWRLGQTL